MKAEGLAVLLACITFGVTYLLATEAMSKDQLKAELGSYFRAEEFDSYKKRLNDLEKVVRDSNHNESALSPNREPEQTYKVHEK